MSLSSWWKSLFKKKPEIRMEESRGPAPRPGQYRMVARPRPVADLHPDRASSYLDRQGYPQGRSRSDYEDGFETDYRNYRADRAALQADFAAAEAALLRDELDAAEHAREYAEERAEDVREDYADHLREDHEADAVDEHSRLSQELDDRPILPNGAVDPTYTANPPQQDSTPEPPKTDADFYGRDSDFYGGDSSTPAPSYEPPPAQETSYSAPDPTPSYEPPSSYDPGPSNTDY